MGARLAAAIVLGLAGIAPVVSHAPPADPPPDHVLCAAEREFEGEASSRSAQSGALTFRVTFPGLTSDGIAAPVAPGLAALEDRLQATLDATTVPGRFAVAVTDLQTMQTIGVRLDRPQLAGCVANLFVIIAALQDVDAGVYPLESVDATIRQTIWASDATAAHQLYELVGRGSATEGVRRVAHLYQVFAMHSSIIDHPPAFPADSLGVSENNVVTAREVNAALATLYRGRALTREMTDYLLEAMTHVKPGLNYLAGVLPAPALVGHKNGFFWNAEGYVDNDAAIVRFGPNYEYAYAFSFYSEAVPTLYAEIPLAQTLMFEVWHYFSAAYPPP